MLPPHWPWVHNWPRARVCARARALGQEVIKEIAQNHAIATGSSSRTFKVVVLNEVCGVWTYFLARESWLRGDHPALRCNSVACLQVDRLSVKAQSALRRTMEKYSVGCRLILSCNSACRVIEPVRSRCMGVRVPAPSYEDIATVLSTVAKAERAQLPPEFAMKVRISWPHGCVGLAAGVAAVPVVSSSCRPPCFTPVAARWCAKFWTGPPACLPQVARASERNLRRALLMLEASKVQAGAAGFSANQVSERHR
jgi:hypothetical protein